MAGAGYSSPLSKNTILDGPRPPKPSIEELACAVDDVWDAPVAGEGTHDSASDGATTTTTTTIGTNNVVLQVFVIRHGRTRENQLHIIQGHMDTLLNEIGMAQARKCATVLAMLPFDAIWSSDLTRCIQTRDIALSSQLATLPVERVHESKHFRERSFGDLEGYPARVAAVELKKRKLTWDTAGEDPKVFQTRLFRGWDAMVEEARTSRFRRVAVVTHGGTT
ncbi:histidine phosphatase superfamily [Limtongia smithiae]|uniref:histidine phosphatase superfamily n=1 Tax=Limtongia smithiae TaxID=1125753 RepID=UPI0034CD6EC5